MKKILLVTIALLVLQTTILLVEAAEGSLSRLSTEKSKFMTWGWPSNMVDIGLGYLFPMSTCSWEISFPDQYGRNRSAFFYKSFGGFENVS